MNAKAEPVSWFQIARASSIGLEIGIAAAIGLWLGRRLQETTQAGAWLPVAGLGLGVVAGMRGALRTATQLTTAQAAKGEDPDVEECE